MAGADERRTRRQAVVAALTIALAYLAAAVLFTWPLAFRLTTHLGAPEGPGDPYLNLWILGWDLRTLTERPSAALNGAIFDARIFHPAADTLAYSDHLIPQALMVLPLFAVTRDPVLCYNVLLLLSLAASGLAMHACARQLGASRRAAWVAGLAWAFWPYRFSHLIHLQLQALYFLPLAVLALHRLIAVPRQRQAIWLGLSAGLQAASSAYYGVMTALALGVLAIVTGWCSGRLRSSRYLGRLFIAALVGTFVVAPLVWPYWRMQQSEGFARNLYEASRHAAVPASYVQVPDSNVLYGRSHALTARTASGELRTGHLDGVEQALFPGFVLAGLALVGLAARRREATWVAVPGLVALVGLGVVLSLGPDGVRTVYSAFHRFVFGFQAVRAPARFAVLATLGLALLAAFGATRLERRLGRLVWVLVACVAIEYASVPLTLVARPPAVTPVARWLGAVPGPGAVVYLPLTNDRENTIAMVDALGHGRPIVNGYSGQRPPFFPALVDALSTFPSAEALWTLRDLDVRFVVVRPGGTAAPPDASDQSASLSPLVERAQFDGARIIELVWTPEVEAHLTPPSAPAPPPPGPPPFAMGERLVYDVRWIGGPMDLPAGVVRLEILPPGTSGTSFRFVATAETAPWVARFFEARDRFQTDADAQLLPTEHIRAQRQGRRSVDRVYSYDLPSGVVRVSNPTTGGAPLALRVPPGTRDALTAFYYIRSVPLIPGNDISLPVNDGGRNRLVVARVVGRERITVAGRGIEALRIEPRIAERVPRRQPVRAVAWVSTDARRLVLAADVEAAFGRMRLELTDYRER